MLDSDWKIVEIYQISTNYRQSFFGIFLEFSIKVFGT